MRMDRSCHGFAEKTGKLPSAPGTIREPGSPRRRNHVKDFEHSHHRRPAVRRQRSGVRRRCAEAKADCEKTKDMKWDDAKKVCVKK